MPHFHLYSPCLVNQVDADRVRRNLYEAGQGQVGINASAQVARAQGEAIVHQAAYKPAVGVKDKRPREKAPEDMPEGSQSRTRYKVIRLSNQLDVPADLPIPV